MLTRLSCVTSGHKSEGKKRERKTAKSEMLFKLDCSGTTKSAEEKNTLGALGRCDVDVSSKGKGTTERHVSSGQHKKMSTTSRFILSSTFFWQAISPQGN